MPERQEYPKAVYRGTVEKPECVIVKDAEEDAIAKLEGYGDHPAHRKPEPEPKLEPKSQPEPEKIHEFSPRAKFPFRSHKE